MTVQRTGVDQTVQQQVPVARTMPPTYPRGATLSDRVRVLTGAPAVPDRTPYQPDKPYLPLVEYAPVYQPDPTYEPPRSVWEKLPPAAWWRGYQPIAQEYTEQRAARRAEIMGAPVTGAMPEPMTGLAFRNPYASPFIDVARQFRRAEQGAFGEKVMDLSRATHAFGSDVLSWMQQIEEATVGTGMGTMENVYERLPGFSQVMLGAVSPGLRGTSPQLRKTFSDPTRWFDRGSLGDIFDPDTALEEVGEIVGESVPTYLEDYGIGERLLLEFAFGIAVDPFVLLGAGAKASQLGRLRRFTSIYFPNQQDMIGAASAMDRLYMRLGGAINQGDVPIVGAVLRHSPHTEAYNAGQDALVYGQWLIDGLLKPGDFSEVAARTVRFISNPEAVVGPSQRAQRLARLWEGLDPYTLPSVAKAMETDMPVNLPRFVAELSDYSFGKQAQAVGLIKDGRLVLPLDTRIVRFIKDIESAFLLGTPRYAIRNAASQNFTALYDGINPFHNLEDNLELLQRAGIGGHQDLYEMVHGVAVRGSGAYEQDIAGANRFSKRMPWARPIQKIAQEGVVGNVMLGDQPMRANVTAAWWRKLWAEHWARPVGGRGMRPVLPDTFGPYGPSINAAVAQSMTVDDAIKAVDKVLKGGGRPALAEFLPDPKHIEPTVMRELEDLWQNAKTPQEWDDAVEQVVRAMQDETAARAALQPDMDIQIGDSFPPVDDQLATLIDPEIPATRQVVEEVAMGHAQAMDDATDAVGRVLTGEFGPDASDTAVRAYHAMITNLNAAYYEAYADATRLTNRFVSERQVLQETLGKKTPTYYDEYRKLWSWYEQAFEKHWRTFQEAFTKQTEMSVRLFEDIASGRAPLSSLDVVDIERVMQDMPELIGDSTITYNTQINRQRLMLERNDAMHMIMSYVARTGDRAPVKWLTDAVEKERHLTDATAGMIREAREKFGRDPEWRAIANRLWNNLNLDQRSIWHAISSAMTDVRDPSALRAPLFETELAIVRWQYANDKIMYLRQLASKVGKGRVGAEGFVSVNDRHIANSLNKAFREAGIEPIPPEILELKGVEFGIEWRDFVTTMDDAHMEIAVRKLHGEALTVTPSAAAPASVAPPAPAAYAPAAAPAPPPVATPAVAEEAVTQPKETVGALTAMQRKWKFGPEERVVTAKGEGKILFKNLDKDDSYVVQFDNGDIDFSVSEKDIRRASEVVEQAPVIAAAPEAPPVAAPAAVVDQLAPSPVDAAPLVEPLPAPERIPAPVAAAPTPRDVPPPKIGVQGKTAQAWVNPEQPYEYAYELGKLEDLQPSHFYGGTENPKYALPEMQNREQASKANRLFIDEKVRSYSPDDYLTPTPAADRGMIKVGLEDNSVEAGNARWQMLSQLDQGKYDEYLQALVQRADEYGFSPEQIQESLAQPGRTIIYQRRTQPVPDRVSYAWELNKDPKRSLSASEAAAGYASNISNEMLLGFKQLSGKGLFESLSAPSNDAFVKAFFDRITPGERVAFLDAEGRLTAAGARVLQDAFWARIFPMDFVRKMTVAATPEAKSIANGIDMSLPELARLRAQIAQGQIEPLLDITDDIVAAVDEFIVLRNLNANSNQLGFFQSTLTPFQETLLKMFEERIRSAKKISIVLDNYVDFALSGGKIGAALFDIGESPSKAYLLGRAMTDQQAGLFDQMGIVHPMFRWYMSRIWAKDLPPSAAQAARHVAQNATEELRFLQRSGNEAFNTTAMPAPADIQANVARWFTDTAIPRMRAARSVVGRAAQAGADDVVLDYGQQRNADRILGLLFPYTFWPTRAGWNWARRVMHHPGTLAAYLNYRDGVREERQSDIGLRPRFWNKVKIEFPWMPDGFEDALYTDWAAAFLPFADLRGIDWDDVDQANGFFAKMLTVGNASGFSPHVPLQMIMNAARGDGMGGAADYIPQWKAARAFVPPNRYTFGPGPQGSKYDLYRLQRAVSSMGAKAMGLPDIGYESVQEIYEASLRHGKQDTAPLLPYAAAEKMVEAWARGELTSDQIEQIFTDPLIKEALRLVWKETGIPEISSFFSGMRLVPVAEGEKIQVATQATERAVMYGGELLGEEGGREELQKVREANPFVQLRWAQYGVLPGEEDKSAAGIYQQLGLSTALDAIEAEYKPEIERLVKEDPANFTLLQELTDSYFDARGQAFQEWLDTEETNPRLWSVYGANPDEVRQIRIEQLYNLVAKERPKRDSFARAGAMADGEITNDEIDWDAYRQATDTWYSNLSQMPQATPLANQILNELGAMTATELQRILSPDAVRGYIEETSQLIDPYLALSRVIEDLYNKPWQQREEEAKARFGADIIDKYNAYTAEVEARYGEDVWDRLAAYLGEVKGRFGEDIFDKQNRYYTEIEKKFGEDILDVQEGYFALPEGSAARSRYLADHPKLKQYWDNKNVIRGRYPGLVEYWKYKDAIQSKYGNVGQYLSEKELIQEKYDIQAYMDEKENIKALFPQFMGGSAIRFVEEVMARYPWFAEKGWDREFLLKAYAEVADIPDADIIRMINTAEREGIPVDVLLAQEQAKIFLEGAPLPEATNTGAGSFANRRTYVRRSYGRGGGGGGGGGERPINYYLPGYTPGATQNRRRVYIP